MELTPQQSKKLYEALKSAFPTIPNLNNLVYFVFGNNVLTDMNRNSVGEFAFGLVQWANAQGEVKNLILGARDENKGNPDLFKIAQELGLEGSSTPRNISVEQEKPKLADPAVNITDNSPRALRSLTVEQCCAVEVCSHLRTIDSKIFATILKVAYPNFFGTFHPFQFEELYQSIKTVEIIESYGNKKEAVKFDLKDYFRREAIETTSEKNERARKVHYAALERYRLWLLGNIDERSDPILEEIFHCASLMELGETHFELVDLFDLRLSTFPKDIQKNSVGWKKTLGNFHTAFKEEKEFKGLLDNVVLDQLDDIINKHRTDGLNNEELQ